MVSAQPVTRWRDRMQSISAVSENSCWSGTATPAVYVALPVCESALSWSTRVPGRSILNLMISLCPACHAKLGRTKAALRAMPPLLLELWREQHPEGHEQTALNFRTKYINMEPVPLFKPEPGTDSVASPLQESSLSSHHKTTRTPSLPTARGCAP